MTPFPFSCYVLNAPFLFLGLPGVAASTARLLRFIHHGTCRQQYVLIELCSVLRHWQGLVSVGSATASRRAQPA